MTENKEIWDEEQVEKYVFCDGELFPIKEMRGYGTRQVVYEITIDGEWNTLEKRLADPWTVDEPEIDIIDEWEAPNGCTIEPDDNGRIPEDYIVLVKRENGKVRALIPAGLLETNDDYIFEAESIEDVAEFIREVQEAWEKDGYEAYKLLKLAVPVRGEKR